MHELRYKWQTRSARHEAEQRDSVENPKPYVCIGCGARWAAGRWWSRSGKETPYGNGWHGDIRYNQPPLCGHCCVMFGSGPVGVSDKINVYYMLRQIAALITLIEYEAHYGIPKVEPRGSRSYHTAFHLGEHRRRASDRTFRPPGWPDNGGEGNGIRAVG